MDPYQKTPFVEKKVLFGHSESKYRETRRCSGVPSTRTTQNYAANVLSRPKRFPRKKKVFSQKMFCRNIVHFCRHLKILNFVIWVIRGCVRPYLWTRAWSDLTSPDRPNRQILDFEMSEKVGNIAKKHFLQKNIFFSWESLGSR